MDIFIYAPPCFKYHFGAELSQCLDFIPELLTLIPIACHSLPSGYAINILM